MTWELCGFVRGSGDQGLTPGSAGLTDLNIFQTIYFSKSGPRPIMFCWATECWSWARVLGEPMLRPIVSRNTISVSHSEFVSLLCNDFYHHPRLIYFPISGFIVILMTARVPLTETAKIVLRSVWSPSRRQSWRPPRLAAPRRTSGSPWSPRGWPPATSWPPRLTGSGWGWTAPGARTGPRPPATTPSPAARAPGPRTPSPRRRPPAPTPRGPPCRPCALRPRNALNLTPSAILSS